MILRCTTAVNGEVDKHLENLKISRILHGSGRREDIVHCDAKNRMDLIITVSISGIGKAGVN